MINEHNKYCWVDLIECNIQFLSHNIVTQLFPLDYGITTYNELDLQI